MMELERERKEEEKKVKKGKGLRCSICGRYFQNAQGLSSHVANVHHGGFKSVIDKFYRFVEMVGSECDGKRLLEIGKELGLAPSTIEYFLGKLRDIGGYHVFDRQGFDGFLQQLQFKFEHRMSYLKDQYEKAAADLEKAHKKIAALRDDILNVVVYKCEYDGSKCWTFKDLILMAKYEAGRKSMRLLPEWQRRLEKKDGDGS